MRRSRKAESAKTPHAYETACSIQTERSARNDQRAVRSQFERTSSPTVVGECPSRASLACNGIWTAAVEIQITTTTAVPTIAMPLGTPAGGYAARKNAAAPSASMKGITTRAVRS